MVSRKIMQKRLKDRIERSDMKTRQLSLKAEIEKKNEPEYVKHYVSEIPLGKERIHRVTLEELFFKDGAPPVTLIDLRKFVKRKRKLKPDQDPFRAVYKQGINYRPESWVEVFFQLTEFTLNTSASEDRIIIMKNIVKHFQDKYPAEFQQAFYPLKRDEKPITTPQTQQLKRADDVRYVGQENIIHSSLLQDQIVKTPEPKRRKPIPIEEQSWIEVISKGKK